MSDRENSSIIKIEGKKDSYELYLKKPLGKGGFAAVYKGKRLSDGQIIAIKKINKRFDYGNKEVEYMEKLSKDPTNRYTVKLLDHYSDNHNELYLILPYYKHGSLRDYIKSTGRSLDTKTAGNILLQLISALSYLHKEKGIMHRDLTSANVMIKDITDDRIDVLLSDFGLAKHVGNTAAKQKQTICGTPGYSAPEVVKKGRYKIGDEVYSLGGILYYMLTGHEPNVGKEKEQLKHVKDGLARDLLDRLWQESPDNRPALREIKECQFLNQYRSSIIKLQHQSSRQRSNSRDCRHRLGADENGKCKKCGEIITNVRSGKASKDSAYGSTNKASNQYTVGKSHQTNEKPASRNTAEGTRKKSSRTPSTNSRQTDDNDNNKHHGKEMQWPVPPFHYFEPITNKPLVETRISNPKGKFIIVNSTLLVFEALSKNEEFVKYIFELELRHGKQEITVFEPKNKNQKLPELEDDLIKDKKFITTVSRANELEEYSKFYKFILKAIEMFYSRNAKIRFSYVDGNRNYEAKLMYDNTFRFVFGNGKIFCQKPDTKEGEYKAVNEGTSLDRDQRNLFIETRQTLLIMDERNTKLKGSYYKPFNWNQKLQ